MKINVILSTILLGLSGISFALSCPLTADRAEKAKGKNGVAVWTNEGDGNGNTISGKYLKYYVRTNVTINLAMRSLRGMNSATCQFALPKSAKLSKKERASLPTNVYMSKNNYIATSRLNSREWSKDRRNGSITCSFNKNNQCNWDFKSAVKKTTSKPIKK